MLTHEIDHKLVSLSRHIAGHRMIRPEDVSAALRRIQLGENSTLQFLFVGVGPGDHIHVAGERDAMPVPAP